MGVLALAFAACGGSSTDNNSGGGGGGGSVDNTPAAATVSVPGDGNGSGKYDPGTTTVKVGDVVKWSFTDDANPHTVTADDNSFDSSQKQKGDTWTHKFDKAGTYAYHCTLHADMKGQVTVS